MNTIQENHCPELLIKYKKLLAFVQEIKDSGCSLIESGNCPACNALDVLRDVGEA